MIARTRDLLRLGALLGTLAAAPLAAQQRALGAFEGQTDVGSPARPGEAAYDSTRQEYVVSGSGANMWDGRDEFHFVWKRMSGDFLLRTRAALVGTGGDPHRKLGWTIRASLDPASPHVTAAVHGDGVAALQFRRAPGAETQEVRSAVSGADVVQLQRRGDRYLMSVARFGDTLSVSEIRDVPLADEVYVGLFVCAHDSTATETARFRDVRLTVPVKEDFTPYRDYIGGRLETLEVATGDRRVLYESPRAIQAPNWTRDGRALIYNEGGRLYRFDLATRTPSLLDTGAATANNNDHVLSFDGTRIGISSSAPDDQNRSNVYVVPIGGGEARRVTERGPSYLHGWSPDGRFLVFTGQRDGDFDVYRIPSDGGGEVRLTDAPGLDDGPEYSPDGRSIYFNSVRSGTMQLWRMNADGSDPRQLTDDSFNNWFPHVSPDGRTLVFLSFPADVEPSDHPWY
jgi:sugar lactone lactonase YvrE